MHTRLLLMSLVVGGFSVSGLLQQDGCDATYDYGVIRGQVLNVRGRPVTEALVHLASRTDCPDSAEIPRDICYTRTDRTGFFRLTEVPPGNQRLEVSATNYFKVHRGLTIEANSRKSVRLHLMPYGDAQKFDASSGITLSQDLMQVRVQPGAFLQDPDPTTTGEVGEGQPVVGTIKAVLAPLQVFTEAKWTMPGPLLGITKPGDDPFPLESYGAFQARFFDESGKELTRLAPGKEAQIKLEVQNAPQSLLSLVAAGVSSQVPMWSLNSEGIWQLEPRAIGELRPSERDGGGPVLYARVPHFSD